MDQRSPARSDVLLTAAVFQDDNGCVARRSTIVPVEHAPGEPVDQVVEMAIEIAAKVECWNEIIDAYNAQQS